METGSLDDAIAAAMAAVENDDRATSDWWPEAYYFLGFLAVSRLRHHHLPTVEARIRELSTDARWQARALVPEFFRCFAFDSVPAPGSTLAMQRARGIERAAVLFEMAARESDARVLSFVILAFTELRADVGVRTTLDFVLPYATRLEPEIRSSVAIVLGGGPVDPVAVPTLIALSRDADADTRCSATEGLFNALGRLPLDTRPEESLTVRDVLAERLADADPLVSAHAMHALACERDERALPAMRSALAAGEPTMELLHAIEEWPSPEYVEALEHMVAPSWYDPQRLRDLIARCRAA